MLIHLKIVYYICYKGLPKYAFVICSVLLRPVKLSLRRAPAVLLLQGLCGDYWVSARKVKVHQPLPPIFTPTFRMS